MDKKKVIIAISVVVIAIIVWLLLFLNNKDKDKDSVSSNSAVSVDLINPSTDNGNGKVYPDLDRELTFDTYRDERFNAEEVYEFPAKLIDVERVDGNTTSFVYNDVDETYEAIHVEIDPAIFDPVESFDEKLVLKGNFTADNSYSVGIIYDSENVTDRYRVRFLQDKWDKYIYGGYSKVTLDMWKVYGTAPEVYNTFVPDTLNYVIDEFYEDVDIHTEDGTVMKYSEYCQKYLNYNPLDDMIIWSSLSEEEKVNYSKIVNVLESSTDRRLLVHDAPIESNKWTGSIIITTDLNGSNCFGECFVEYKDDPNIKLDIVFNDEGFPEYVLQYIQELLDNEILMHTYGG